MKQKPFCKTRTSILTALLSISLAACVTSPLPRQTKIAYAKLNINAPAIVYVNGLWHKQTTQEEASSDAVFVKQDKYSKDGIFVSEEPADAITIDLQGAYLITPFGEAHNHSVGAASTSDTANTYLREGVFYYKNPNNLASVTASQRSFWERADTLDVVFSNGGISVVGGHPDMLYRQLTESYNMAVDELPGNAFFAAPTVESLRAQWPKILDGKPDFIKLYLLRHDTDKSEGLSEEVFREAVSLARASNLRTSVHLESMADLKLAVDAGANESAHLVSRKQDTALVEDGLISDELVQQIAKQRFVTVTTTRIAVAQYQDRPELLSKIQNVQKQNLRRLSDAGAPIAIGTDNFSDTLQAEIDTLRSLGVFSDKELLTLMLKTPRTSIFPNRAIGSFTPGHEVSFIGLKCNPFEDFTCIEKISHRIKQGIDLNEIIKE